MFNVLTFFTRIKKEMAHSSSNSEERSIHDMLYDKDTPSMKMNESAIQSGKIY